MADDLLLIGTKIELKRNAGKGLEDINQEVTYVSQILDKNADDDSLVIAMPIQEGHIVPLEIGNIMWAYFYTSKGIYRSKCKVSSRGKEGNIFVASIQLTGKLEKFQRREFYRLSCTIDAQITQLIGQEVIEYSEKHEFSNKLSAEPEDAVIVDISGGGLRFISEKKYDKGSYVYLTFKVPYMDGKKEFNIMGRVVLSFNADDELKKYDNRVQFKVISKDVREEIIKFIFDEQRRIRKKERG